VSSICSIALAMVGTSPTGTSLTTDLSYERAKCHDRRNDEEYVTRLTARGKLALGCQTPELARHVTVGADHQRDRAQDAQGTPSDSIA
jgi:hypothetical protein